MYIYSPMFFILNSCPVRHYIITYSSQHWGSSGLSACDLQHPDGVISLPKMYIPAQIDFVASLLLRPTGQRNGHN